MTRAEIIHAIRHKYVDWGDSFRGVIDETELDNLLDEYDRLVVESFGADVPPVDIGSRE
jgi:hypothetical protein